MEFPKPYVEKAVLCHRDSITSLFFNPNGRQIVTGSLDKSVMIYDNDAKLSYKFTGHTRPVMDVTFYPSGDYIASASCDKTVRICSPDPSGDATMFKVHSEAVLSVQFSPDGYKIITASADKTIKLTAIEKLKFISSFAGHTATVKCARMSNDCSLIASCAEDHCMKLWNPDSGQCICTIQDTNNDGLHLDWSPSGNYIAVGTNNGEARVYDIRTQGLVQSYRIHEDIVPRVAFHPISNYLLTSSRDGTVKLLDLYIGRPVYTMNVGDRPINAVNVSYSGNSFATGGDARTLVIWRTRFNKTNGSNEDVEDFLKQETKASTSKRNDWKCEKC